MFACHHSVGLAKLYCLCIIMTISDYFRTGLVCYLPTAISVPDFRRQVMTVVGDKYPDKMKSGDLKIPSLSWVTYQFAPRNERDASALQYTGINCPLLRIIYILLPVA